MRLYNFTAPSINAAMQQIREQLGEDAVIVSSTKEARGGVRVVAAKEEDKFEQSPYAVQRKDERSEIAKKVSDIFRFHNLPQVIGDKLVASLDGQQFLNPRAALESIFFKNFAFSALKLTGTKPIMLFGMPGIGKTLAISKLAAEAVFLEKKPNVITTDIKRAGGVEQLTAFTKILNVELSVARNPKDLAKSIKEKAADVVLIDSAGVNPYNSGEIESLKAMIMSVDVEPVMVMPAGIDVEEAVDMCRAFHIIGAKKLLVTKADSARRYGSILTAAKVLGLEFTNFSGTPNVAKNLDPITPKSLTNLFLKPFE